MREEPKNKKIRSFKTRNHNTITNCYSTKYKKRKILQSFTFCNSLKISTTSNAYKRLNFTQGFAGIEIYALETLTQAAA